MLSFISPEQTGGLPALSPGVISGIKGLLSSTALSSPGHTDINKHSKDLHKNIGMQAHSHPNKLLS